MDAADQIAVVHRELRVAADAILDAATAAMALSARVRVGEPEALDALDGMLLTILEATAFEDLAGQRLARLSATLSGQMQSDDPLLNGPADSTQGVNQDAADVIFSSGHDDP